MRLAAAVIVCGLAFPAWAQTPSELKDAAESIRPALVEAMKPVYQGKVLTENVYIGLKTGWNSRRADHNTFVGTCSGTSFLDGNDNILVGDHTATPTPHTSGFVSIGNKLCFWRATGERTDCPPPEPDCGGAK